MTRIVTTTYRYKPPPKRKGRKLAEITGPAVVTSVDPRRGSRRRDDQGDGQGATAAGQSTRLERADQQQPSTAPERRRDPVVTTAESASARHRRRPAPLGHRHRKGETAPPGAGSRPAANPQAGRARWRRLQANAGRDGPAAARRMSGRLSRRAHAPDDARRELRRRARLVQIVALAQAEAERKGRGRLARVWAAWRGE